MYLRVRCMNREVTRRTVTSCIRESVEMLSRRAVRYNAVDTACTRYM